MRRAKHPLPVEMYGIKTDPETSKYINTPFGDGGKK